MNCLACIPRHSGVKDDVRVVHQRPHELLCLHGHNDAHEDSVDGESAPSRGVILDHNCSLL